MLRLYPPYLFAIVLNMATGWFYWPQLLPSLLLITPLLDINIWTLWFIPLIILLNCVAYVVSQIHSRPLQYAVAACLWIVLLVLELETGLIDLRLVALYPALLLGLFAARIDSISSLLGKGLPTICAAVVSVCLVLTPTNWEGSATSLLHATIAATSLAIAFTSACFLITRWIGGRFWFLLCYGSYFAYLIHRAVLNIAVRLYDKAGFRLCLGVYLYAICLPIVIVLACGLQWLFSIVVEKIEKHPRLQSRFGPQAH